MSETLHGPVRRRPDGCGLGRGLLDRAADIIAARARSESLPRHSDASTHMHMSHAPAPEPNRARMIWRTRIGVGIDTVDVKLTLTIQLSAFE